MRIIAAAAFAALALTACSKADQAQVKDDTHSVAADARQSAHDVTSSEAAQDLKAKAKDAAQDTGHVLKKGLGELKEGVTDAGKMAKEGAANIRADVADHDEETTTTTTTTTKRTTTR